MQKQKIDTRQLIVMALFCALAFASVAVFRIPVVLFLKYEPKDCLLAIGGMLYGPGPALLMSVVVSLIECFTISDTGWIGLIMNVLSSALFICPAAMLYHRRRTLSSAVLGLILGALLTTAGMLLWNWLITPLYMHIPREQIEPLLLTAFLPFNLLKSAFNTVLTVLLYKSVVSALRAAKLVPKSNAPVRRGIRVSVLLTCLFCLVTLILILLVWRGIL
ncbi:MAG: ECF transporter S component [Clostridia bacterium]|nr:ECF transporter S component [Clostridia bacterium]